MAAGRGIWSGERCRAVLLGKKGHRVVDPVGGVLGGRLGGGKWICEVHAEMGVVCGGWR